MNKTECKKKVGVIGCAGDRRDEDIITIGKYAGEIFDDIIIRHDKNSRGRSNENLTELIMQGVNSIRESMSPVVISDETEAIAFAIDNSINGSFIVISSDAPQQSIDYITARLQKNKDLILQTNKVW